MPIETVNKMLAHGSVRVTQIYAKITRKKVSEDMRDLRKKLFSPNGKLKAAKQTAEAIKKIRQVNVAIAKVAG